MINKNRLLMAAALLVAMPLSADTFSVQPSPANVTVGQTFSLDVDVAGATDLYAYQFDLGFDPTVLAADSVTEGGFLTSVGATTFFPGTIDNIGGTVSFNADSLNGAPSGGAGSGTLVTFEFTAIGTGSTAVNIFNVLALNSFGEGLTVDTTAGTVNVAAAVPEPSSLFLLLVFGLLAVPVFPRLLRNI